MENTPVAKTNQADNAVPSENTTRARGMATDGKSIKVKIFGSEYPLRGESEDLTKKVASYVDQMINTIHDKIPEQPPLTVAVLSALNITEELFKEREKNRTLTTLFESEVGKINDYLDQCLSSEA
jgi:cell division protein ZapA